MLAATLGLFLFGPVMVSGTDVSQPPEIPNACGSEKYQIMIGKTRLDVEEIGIEPPIRIIPYGNFVTLEFVPNRINFRLDERGLVVRVYCG
ncbi:MAG: hypothetical protein GXP05_16070 [Alphaproteobacteria bacterium]|nr:hypothetical protein [Alphaproteobacteria bacterium]